MQLLIQHQTDPPDEALRAYVESALLERLGHHRRLVARVTAHTSPRACRLLVHLAPSGALAVEERDAEPRRAAARAAESAGKAVSRELARRKGRTPRPGRAAYAGME